LYHLAELRGEEEASMEAQERKMAHGMADPAKPSTRSGNLREVAAFFFRLGWVAFGGPAAHIAMMRDEVVRKRHWVSEERFLDLLGLANVIPGPSSTELAIYLGYERAGLPGLALAGTLFILPAMLIVLLFAWAYTQFGALPQVAWAFYGVKPVIIAIILQAVMGLARTAFKTPLLVAIGLVALASNSSPAMRCWSSSAVAFFSPCSFAAHICGAPGKSTKRS
jgi:chromate transporter